MLSSDISDPTSWSAAKPFFPVALDIIKQPQGHGWLDFWVICDDKKCYLFNTDDHGRLLRSETDLRQFPHGFHSTVAVMTEKTEDLFEASNTTSNCRIASASSRRRATIRSARSAAAKRKSLRRH